MPRAAGTEGQGKRQRPPWVTSSAGWIVWRRSYGQQQAFSIALIRLEESCSADPPPPLPADPAQSAAVPQATGGSSSVVPPAPNNSNREHHQTFPHRRDHETEDDHDGELFQMSHKIEFPKFNGTTDPLPWLNRCERYFHIHGTPEHHRVHYASFYPP
jgi:hypothetical protein